MGSIPFMFLTFPFVPLERVFLCHWKFSYCEQLPLVISQWNDFSQYVLAYALRDELYYHVCFEILIVGTLNSQISRCICFSRVSVNMCCWELSPQISHQNDFSQECVYTIFEKTNFTVEMFLHCVLKCVFFIFFLRKVESPDFKVEWFFSPICDSICFLMDEFSEELYPQIS